MLKGINLNGEIKFIDIDSNEAGELIDYDDLLEYCCIYGDLVEKVWYMVVGKFVLFEDDEITEVAVSI